MPPRRDKNESILRARALRRDMTLPEGLLWRELRKRPGGFKFRRQHPFGRCIVDFYCPAVRLVVEVDGMSHEMEGRAERDARRDAWLREQGLRVLRIAAVDVLRDMEAVLVAILAAAGNFTPPPCFAWFPSPRLHLGEELRLATA
jgi:very-short-patch-repair endonuclease